MFYHFFLYEFGGFVSVCYDLHRLFEMLQIHLRNKQCIFLHVLSMLLFNCFWCLKDGLTLSLLLLCFSCVCVCVKMTILFCIYFRQYTNMCMGANGDVCLWELNKRMLLVCSHYVCFYLFFDHLGKKKKHCCDTFALFSSFLDGASKNSKRKSSADFFSLFCWC